MAPNERDSKTESVASKIEYPGTVKKENNPGNRMDICLEELEVGKQRDQGTTKAISTEKQNQNTPTVVRLGDGNENTATRGLLRTYYEDFDDDADDELSDVDLAQFDLDELLNIEKEDASLDTEMEDIISENLVRPLTPKGHHNSPGGESSAPLPKSSLEEETLEMNGIINGIEVTLTIVRLSEQEMELHKDGRLGKFRCKCPSSLRQCWLPL
jgi:hypothetical protein